MFAFTSVVPVSGVARVQNGRARTCARHAETDNSPDVPFESPAPDPIEYKPIARPIGGNPQTAPIDAYSPYLKTIAPKATYGDSPAPEAEKYEEYFKGDKLFKAPLIRIVHTPGTDGSGSEVGLEMVEVPMGNASAIQWAAPRTKQPCYVPQSQAGNMNKKWV